MAPSLRHCSVGAVVAGAADGADVSVNAQHVCRDAAFLHPPTHCLLRHTVCLLLPDGLRLPCKGKLLLTSFKRKYWSSHTAGRTQTGKFWHVTRMVDHQDHVTCVRISDFPLWAKNLYSDVRNIVRKCVFLMMMIKYLMFLFCFVSSCYCFVK